MPIPFHRIHKFVVIPQREYYDDDGDIRCEEVDVDSPDVNCWSIESRDNNNNREFYAQVYSENKAHDLQQTLETLRKSPPPTINIIAAANALLIAAREKADKIKSHKVKTAIDKLAEAMGTK